MPNEIKKVNDFKKTIQDQMDKNRTNYDNILQYQPQLDIMMKNVREVLNIPDDDDEQFRDLIELKRKHVNKFRMN